MYEDLRLSNYDYFLDKKYIATRPVYPKENAKLLVYERKSQKITHSTFAHLADFLPPCDLVFNDTKVIKARIYGHKESGGKIELFIHTPLNSQTFLAQIKGRVKIGEILHFEQGLRAEILELLSDGLRIVKLRQNEKILDPAALYALLEIIGHTPLPPYIKRADEKSDEKDYQSIFAKNLGAVAAPTASLHFSKEMIENLKQKHEFYSLTLHIGAGTFKGVESEDLREHKMHKEFFHIPEKTRTLINSKNPLLCVGTTTVRTVEYYARTGIFSGECDLFLHPQNLPVRVDYLLTNFHLPRSTLIMLVAAFVGREKTLALYDEAIKREYRFYSYGDGMLIL